MLEAGDRAGSVQSATPFYKKIRILSPGVGVEIGGRAGFKIRGNTVWVRPHRRHQFIFIYYHNENMEGSEMKTGLYNSLMWYLYTTYLLYAY